MLHTSYNLLVIYGACQFGLERFHAYLATIPDANRDTLIPLSVGLDEGLVEWTIWALHAVPESEECERDRIARLFACEVAESIMPIFEARYPGDRRPRTAIETARRFALGTVSKKELSAARSAARSAADCATGIGAIIAASSAASSATKCATEAAAECAAWSTVDYTASGAILRRLLAESFISTEVLS